MNIDRNQQNKSHQTGNPLDDVIKTILKSQAKSCVRAQIKLEEIEKQNDEK